MELPDKPFVIGIDLGTTNCAVSCVDLRKMSKEGLLRQDMEKKEAITIFNIPQLTGPGEFTRSDMLPSFLYLPGEYDISKESLRHPWKKSHDRFAGVFARDHGAQIPSRLVSSAKSWLCHSGVDREAKILPWGAGGVEKVSPVTATAQYLKHIRRAWNYYIKDEDLFLENQAVVITVPASFDETARDLTLKASLEAGFGNSVILLEEPLAAFYSWLIAHEGNWHEKVGLNELILVCDVGGGTTDFSLITLKTSRGTPRFERVAVGDHLVLGGDNIDLALAGLVESRFKTKTKLSADKLKTLCHRCRGAKERLLEKQDKAVRITLKGEGRSLIAGTLAADLTYEDLEQVLMNRFFTPVEPGKAYPAEQGQEMGEGGLLYEKDTAITRHLIHFLEKHRQDIRAFSQRNDPVPDYILFNGGTLKPGMIQERIREVICEYYGCEQGQGPSILENNLPYLAVGIGASYYGLVKQGMGVRVGSGSPRGYYIKVSTKEVEPPKAVCFVERGLDEGSHIELCDHEFEVRTNQPVSFDVYSSSYRSGDKAGTVVDIDGTLTPMPPVRTVINFGKKETTRLIPVSIEAQYTEMGTLAMNCRSRVSDHQWALHFQLRDSVPATGGIQTDIFDSELIEQANDHIRRVFLASTKDEAEINQVVRAVEKTTGRGKGKWPMSFLRTVADTLLDMRETREKSAVHEARWLNLTGFCMRPGFGDAFDENRIKKIWKVYLSGPVFEKSKQNRLEWWIFMRRIAGGLKAGQQRQFFQNVSSELMVKKNDKIKISPQEWSEMWMAMANMERLLVKDKIALARFVFTHLVPGKNGRHFLWVLSRLGARELLYGSNDRVVPPGEVFNWMKRLFKMKWPEDDQPETALAQMGRMTGDRTRDLDTGQAEMLTKWLEGRNAGPELVRLVNEKVRIRESEHRSQFGEGLPEGLVLKKNKSAED